MTKRKEGEKEEYVKYKHDIAAPIIEDLTMLITKKVEDADRKEIYFEKLTQINDLFVSKISEASSDQISLIYIKYCICFVINMDVKDTVACFSLEPSSVHMIRYRLKKKFNLETNDDLEIYLANLLISSNQTEQTTLP